VKNYEHKTGVTLVEMLIVVAITVILTTMVIGIAARIDDQSKERLTRNTIAIVSAALREFHDYGYRYKDVIYSEFDFPLDCSNFNNGGIENSVTRALGLAPGSVVISGGTLNIEFSACEAMYFYLSQVPECRKTLDKIDESLLTNLGDDKQPRNIEITDPSGITKVYPLFRIIDPWGTALQYAYYDNMTLDPRSRRTFPLITSAGPDTKFGPGVGAEDNISSRE
jgi:type II secretory pathway pseudopilin PulG